MDLQPIYPGRCAGPGTEILLPGACMGCPRPVLTSTGFADLDGPRFSFHCIFCASLQLRRSQIIEALLARDLREGHFETGRYALAGRVG